MKLAIHHVVPRLWTRGGRAMAQAVVFRYGNLHRSMESVKRIELLGLESKRHRVIETTAL